MTNEEKARKIAHEYFRRGQLGLAPISTENAGYESALKAMEWKDEQHAQEKQQWIDKACEWINDNYFEYLQPISCYEQLKDSIDINDFVNDFKQAMKGE